MMLKDDRQGLGSNNSPEEEALENKMETKHVFTPPIVSNNITLRTLALVEKQKLNIMPANHETTCMCP